MTTLSGVDPITELAVAARNGQFETVRALIDASERDVRAFCNAVGRSSETDDLVQETFIRVVSSLASFRGDGSGRAWILGIARHVCADDHRRASRQHALITRVRSRSTRQATPSRDGEFEIDELLRELDVDQLHAFVLTQIHGLSYLETAQICEVAVGTIRSRVSRAREQLVRKIRSAEAS